MAAEFLPLCDNLFNIISLSLYFINLIFDIVLGYALLERGKINYFIAVVVIVSVSLIVSQVMSLRWYFNSKKIRTLATTNSAVAVPPISKLTKYCVIGMHVSQMGVLWRYAKLFVPVDLRYVKHEVRDLCILRLIHAFCEAAPMLLLQSYILITLENNHINEININTIKIKTLGGQLSTHLVQQSTIVHQYQQKTFKDLSTISAILSLFSLCWSLASFSKNVRIHNVHRLVLTWLGVIFQFMWRLGTVSSRVISLTVYASVYGHWIFLVIVLHFLSMFLWLISPKNAFHGERISRLKKVLMSLLIAFIYIFAYINLQEVNHRQKMTIFYVVMFLENCLLVCLWLFGVWPDRSEEWYMIPVMVFCCFVVGILLMLIYYRFFHIRRLGYETDADIHNKFSTPYANVCRCNNPLCGSNPEGTESKYSNMFPEPVPFQKKERGYYVNGCEGDNEGKFRNNIPTNEHLKGIFNCRFSYPVNNATKRKKKKPTSFVPPPVLGLPTIPANMSNISNVSNVASIDSSQLSQLNGSLNGPMLIPFWRRPLPRSHMTGGSSENEGSVGSSRVNIQMKLQEKKQKQLAELKIIEEEIKQGKLGRPNKLGILEGCDNEDGKMSLLPRQPIPRTKKHIDIESIELRRNSSGSETDCQMNILLHHHQQQQMQQKLDNSNIMYNNFSSNSGNGMASALTKFSHEILSNIGDNSNKSNIQASASSTMTSTTSENENSSLTRQMVSSRKKLLHHNLNSSNLSRQITPSPSCHYDPRQQYSSLESKSKNDTNRSNNSKAENRSLKNNSGTSSSNNNTNSIEKDASLASQLIKRQMKRANTPEILLAPNHLDGNPHYYLNGPGMSRGMCEAPNNYMSDFRNNHEYHPSVHTYDRSLEYNDCDKMMQNIPSDIDSQMSLPRSYTLPREFKFNRKYEGRKMIKNEHFIASTNSSDGDVDSCDDNEFEDDDDDHLRPGKGPMNQRHMRNFNRRTNNLNKSNYMNKNIMHSSNNGFNNLTTNNLNNNMHPVAEKYPPYNLRTNISSPSSNIKVNNLDLINDCMESVTSYDQFNQSNLVGSRQMRMRYGNHAFNRHETKL